MMYCSAVIKAQSIHRALPRCILRSTQAFGATCAPQAAVCDDRNRTQRSMAILIVSAAHLWHHTAAGRREQQLRGFSDAHQQGRLNSSKPGVHSSGLNVDILWLRADPSLKLRYFRAVGGGGEDERAARAQWKSQVNLGAVGLTR